MVFEDMIFRKDEQNNAQENWEEMRCAEDSWLKLYIPIFLSVNVRTK